MKGILTRGLNNVKLSHGIGLRTVSRLRRRGFRTIEIINGEIYVPSSHLVIMEDHLESIRQKTVYKIQKKSLEMARLNVKTTRTIEASFDQFVSMNPFTCEMFAYPGFRKENLWAFSEEIVNWHHGRREYLYVREDSRMDKFESACVVYAWLMTYHEAEMEWFDNHIEEIEKRMANK